MLENSHQSITFHIKKKKKNSYAVKTKPTSKHSKSSFVLGI